MSLLFLAIAMRDTRALAQSQWQGDPNIPGNWSGAGNWTPGESGLGEPAHIDNGGVAQVTDIDEICSDLFLGTALGDAGTLEVLSGQLNANMLFVGAGGTGSLLQSGGAIVASQLIVADEPDAIGIYDMNGDGTLIVDAIYAGRGASALVQSDGLVQAGYLRAPAYTLSNGRLELTNGAYLERLELAGGHGTIIADAGLIDLSDAQILQAQGTVYMAGQHSLTILPDGFDPYANFYYFRTTGAMCNRGGAATIRADMNVQAGGLIEAQLEVRGHLSEWQEEIHLNGGLAVRGSGVANLNNGTVHTWGPGSGVADTASLSVLDLFVNSATFAQTGGAATIGNELNVNPGATYQLAGGQLTERGLSFIAADVHR